MTARTPPKWCKYMLTFPPPLWTSSSERQIWDAIFQAIVLILPQTELNSQLSHYVFIFQSTNYWKDDCRLFPFSNVKSTPDLWKVTESLPIWSISTADFLWASESQTPIAPWDIDSSFAFQNTILFIALFPGIHWLTKYVLQPLKFCLPNFVNSYSVFRIRSHTLFLQFCFYVYTVLKVKTITSNSVTDNITRLQIAQSNENSTSERERTPTLTSFYKLEQVNQHSNPGFLHLND